MSEISKSPQNSAIIGPNKYLNLAPKGLKGTSKVSHDAQAEQVAQEFEALFLNMMLKSMRQTAAPEDESNARNIYTSMLDNEYSQEMAKNRSFGIKEMILKWIEQNSHSDSLKTVNKDSNININEINPKDISAKMAVDQYMIQSRMITK